MICNLDWERSSSILDLQDRPKASRVTHSWVHTLFGPGLSGPISKKLHPQLTWRTVCAGATQVDTIPALVGGRRAKREVSLQWAFGGSLAGP